MDAPSGEITRLLTALSSGNREHEVELLTLLYDELRRIAASHLRNERANHTLQPTALVHEAYIRLVEQKEQNWQNRAHFLAIAAHLMRQILIDYARRRKAFRRGGGEQLLSLTEVAVASPQRPEELLALDEALVRLETIDRRQGRIVELRFFGGMTEEEIGILLGLSTRTVKRDWHVARAWLYAEMTR